MDETNTDWVAELVTIMERLRAPDGCPWDAKQTHKTLLPYLIEEAYEFIDAVEDGNDAEMSDELGDLLLQIVFHCQLAKEDDRFDLQGAALRCCEKMIRRHPHVFGDSDVNDAEGVLQQWEEIKKAERGESCDRKSLLDGIPRQLPAIARSEKLQRRAAKVGYDWPDVQGVFTKLEEEICELRNTKDNPADELGDILFTAVNLCRHYGVDADEALRGANSKFERRFRHAEASAGCELRSLDAEALDTLWNQAKEDG
ncbi:MAG: MazG family protein [Rhodothermales bacterium]|jgi:MazG family protein